MGTLLSYRMLPQVIIYIHNVHELNVNLNRIPISNHQLNIISIDYSGSDGTKVNRW